MKVTQISIFIENRAGRLAEVADTLGKNGINIRALSLADTSEFGILRLIVNDAEKASKILKAAGFTLGKTEVLAVEVPDRPGGLSEILKILESDKINVEYMYAFVEKATKNAVLIFRFENLDKAISTLQKNNVRILKGEEIAAL